MYVKKRSVRRSRVLTEGKRRRQGSIVGRAVARGAWGERLGVAAICMARSFSTLAGPTYSSAKRAIPAMTAVPGSYERHKCQ